MFKQYSHWVGTLNAFELKQKQDFPHFKIAHKGLLVLDESHQGGFTGLSKEPDLYFKVCVQVTNKANIQNIARLSFGGEVQQGK